MAIVVGECPMCSNTLEWGASLIPQDRDVRYGIREVPLLYALAAAKRPVFCECCQLKYEVFPSWDLDLVEMRVERVR